MAALEFRRVPARVSLSSPTSLSVPQRRQQLALARNVVDIDSSAVVDIDEAITLHARRKRDEI